MAQLKSKSGKWALYGDADAQIVVCGHSHTVSILEATMLPGLHARTAADIAVCYTADWTSGPPGSNDYWDFVAEVSAEKHLVVVWNGNQHNANFMFQTQPKFTFLGVTSDQHDQDAVPIPLTMIKDFFKPSFEELTVIIPSLSNAASISLLNGPAPKKFSHINNAILQEKYFTDLAASLGVDVNDLVITSDSLRLELWKVLSGLLENYANTLGVNFINAPSVSLDDFGMLLPQYWTPDVTHANSKYGILLIEELGKLIGNVQN